MDFELPEELRLLKDTVRMFVDRELIPVEMNAMDGPRMRSEVRADLEDKAKELGCGISTCRRSTAAKVSSCSAWWWSGRRSPAPSRCRRGPRRVRAGYAAGPVHAQSGAEGEVSVPGAARREEDRVRAVRARRRLRSRRDAHHRGAQGRSLRHQRLQALDHQARPTPISFSLSPRPTAARAAAAA